MGEVSLIPKYGNSSQDVKTVQSALNKNGARLKVDGVFGQRTRSAIIAVQKENRISPADGGLDKETLSAIGVSVKSTSPPGDKVTTGRDPDEGTAPWYRRMFAACEIDPGYESEVAHSVETVERGFDTYLEVAKRLKFKEDYLEFFAYILGAIHFKEASCNFSGVLHNGEKIIGTKRKTILVPKGRGPFSTWEDAAVDAISMNGSRWERLKGGSTDIGDVLYALERYNGTGYITGAGRDENSPYLWARSNINDDKGKYVSDGKFDRNYTTQKTTGAAVILKELWKQGKFQCKVES